MATNGSTIDNKRPVCGVIMPISAIDGCSAEHWSEVLSILRDVIKSAGFDPNLVSDSDDIGIIQKRIVQNVYNNEVVVCDVSGKNPNVMFELGMRLAFDKATIIIKDDLTDYSFDTSVIEHLSYPRDLRFSKIVEFKELLKAKIIATYNRSKSDPNYSTFLKSFGEYKVSRLEQREVSSEAYIMESLEELKKEVRALSRSPLMGAKPNYVPTNNLEDVIAHRCATEVILEFAEEKNITSLSQLRKFKKELLQFAKDHEHMRDAHGPEERIVSSILTSLGSNDLREKLQFMRPKANLSESAQDNEES